MIIKVKVKPNSLNDNIEKVSEGEYAIAVRERAEDGKANVKIINLLSKEFDVDFRKIKIKNPTSRKKIIEISD